MLQEVYGDFPHHNDRMHLAGGVPDHATWQSRWRRLAAQSASWYFAPPSKVGFQFTSVLAAEWRGVLDWKWNSKRPLVFSHVVLTRTLSSFKAREIRARIDRYLDLWERGIYSVLLGGALSEGRAREGRVKQHK